MMCEKDSRPSCPWPPINQSALETIDYVEETFSQRTEHKKNAMKYEMWMG